MSDTRTTSSYDPTRVWLPADLPVTSSAHRLFCFSYAGGSASIYRAWAASLSPLVEVCPVELPGHWLRLGEPAYTSMDALQADLVPALLPYMQQPFSLFGYSMGALIAYVLACNVAHEHGLNPQHLLAAASVPPQGRRSTPKLSALGDAALVDALAKRYTPMPEQVRNDPEMRSLVLQITRADFRILESYEHRDMPRLRCPITVFGGEDEEGVDHELLSQWRVLSEGPCSVQMFPGDHFFINQNGPRLIAAVRAALS